MKNPSDFKIHPWSSILYKSECETIARNIMVILSRTGNKWRTLSFEEYETERKKDGNWSMKEARFFDQVLPYTVSEAKARSFSNSWKEIPS